MRLGEVAIVPDFPLVTGPVNSQVRLEVTAEIVESEVN